MSIINKIKNNKFFRNMFGFESGIDIADDTQVLYRKNVVIKNIIMVSNIIFTLIFSLLSIGEHTNIILMLALLPITYLYNKGLKRTINNNPNDYMTQSIASYINCFYMLLLSIVIYVKLKYGSVVFLQECGYILIYYSLAVCSFYQNKKLLKLVFEWTFVLMLLLHLVVTYPVVVWANNLNFISFVKEFVTGVALRDIIVRTILLCAFMLVLYCIVSMSGYMQEERKKELIKRREVQEDFTNVVTDIFNSTLDTDSRDEGKKMDIILISKMSRRLSGYLSLPEEECKEIETYAKIHIERHVDFAITGSTEDEKFEILKEQTALGNIIIKRLQLERKCEQILRSIIEQSETEIFKEQLKKIQPDLHGQVIMTCDLYVSMRSASASKKAYNHKSTMNCMEKYFQYYIDPVVYEFFTRFADEFEKIYDENGEIDDEL